MKLSGSLSKLLITIMGVTLFVAACDFAEGRIATPDTTQGVIKTIHPATLTAISVAESQQTTPVPDPLGIPWSDIHGIEIDFWYIWDGNEPGSGFNAIIDRFNRENEWNIKVSPFDQGLTHEPLDSIETAFEEGLFPQAMIIDTISAARWYQEGITLDLTPYLSDPAAGMDLLDQKDYYSGIFNPYNQSGSIRPGIPFTQTIQVIYYNQTWAADLGFSRAPGSLSDLVDQSCKAAEENPESTGIILYPEAANIAGWIFAYQGNLIDSTGSYDFSSPEIIDVSLEWQDLMRNQCGSMISDYPNPMALEIEFARFNARQALMVMNSSQYFGQIHQQTSSAGNEDVWTMLPFLGPNGERAVASQVQSGVIFKSTPAEQLAAWIFLKYLTSPQVQAEWVQSSFYYPTRNDSLRFLKEYRTENPDWAKGLDLLKYARTQPVDPSWEIVQQAVGDAFEDLLSGDLPAPVEILSKLSNTAAELETFSAE